jgi:hypothetical protein
MDDLTTQLLRITGSPFVESRNNVFELYSNELFLYAKKNRMPLLYLKSIQNLNDHHSHYQDYIELKNQWVEIEKRITNVIRILNDNGIEYLTFKSIKPYQEVTVDIDLLIINSYEEVIKLLKKSGYKMLEKGPLSSTFRDPRFKIDYDIYNEVGVSNIIYFDKDVAKLFVEKKQFQIGGYIKSLSSEMDLLAVIAHSVIKEQMYTLSEYYSTLYYLNGMGDKELEKFIDMAKRLKLTNAVRAHTSLTYYLHKLIFGTVPTPLLKIILTFGLNNFEIGRSIKCGLIMPHKFHPLTLMFSFWEKIHELKMRRSVAEQFRSMVSIDFTLKFIPKFIKHAVRESY